MKKVLVLVSVVSLALLTSCNSNSQIQEKDETIKKDEMMKDHMKKDDMMKDDMMKDDMKKDDMKKDDMKKDDMKKDDMKKDDMKKKDEMMKDDMMKDHMMKDDMMKDKVAAGMYKNYSKNEVKNTSGNIVLFFHANWCPACRKADSNLSSESIPDNLTIFKVNYDNASDLKQKYGVTTQTTFVQIDKEGNMVKKWVGGSSVADVVKNIK